MSKVYALYEFEAELDCELSIYAGEELHLVDDRDNEVDSSLHSFQWIVLFLIVVVFLKEDDGWTKVRNSNGNIGIVPSTYIQVGNVTVPAFKAILDIFVMPSLHEIIASRTSVLWNSWAQHRQI